MLNLFLIPFFPAAKTQYITYRLLNACKTLLNSLINNDETFTVRLRTHTQWQQTL